VRDYPIALAAGQALTVNVAAHLVRLKDSSGALLVEGFKDGLSVLYSRLRPGNAHRIIGGIDRLLITNETLNEITATLILGNGEFQDDRVPNTIVVNGAPVIESITVSIDPISPSNYPAYMMSVANIAVAGQFSQAQLYNPIGSGKKLLVYRAVLRVYNPASQVQLLKTTGGFKLGGAANQNGKLDSADPNSVAELWKDSNATVLDTRNAVEYFMASHGLASNFVIPLEAHQIPLYEGEGLAASGSSTNEYCGLVAEFEERPL